MADLTFYTNPMSRGQIVRWALHEAGADYDTVILDYGTTMKAAEFLGVNPMGKVPAIVHQGRTVTEAAAICAYLAEAFPKAGLAPSSDDERADYYRWLFFAAGPLEQAITAHTVLKVDPTTEQRAMVGFGSYDDAVEALAGMLANRDYVCGERFTMADVYIGSQVGWGVEFGTLPKRPEFDAYTARVQARPAYREAKEIDGKLIADMQAKS